MLHSETGRRRILLERDGNRCRVCGADGVAASLRVVRTGVLAGDALPGADELVIACRECADKAESLRVESALTDRNAWKSGTARTDGSRI